jgi:2-polyprenyl-3-methyl-5-hydroxy-6-metoxy-1,4-benzoquinol methylase
MNHTPELEALVNDLNAKGGVYHRFDFGGGLVLNGVFDLAPHLHHLRLPERLDGKTVLDVGAGAGFMSIECARRGATVTAVDIVDENVSVVPRIAAAAGVPVRFRSINIYDLDAAFGQFDLVLCGSLLCHLGDQLGAIERLRAVCRDRAILWTITPWFARFFKRPIAEYFGDRATDGAYFHHWSLGATALSRLMTNAGFKRTADVDYFTLLTQSGERHRHVVMSGYVE